MDYAGMKFNAEGSESIEVDFERKILLTNPTRRSMPWRKDTAKGGCRRIRYPMPLDARVNSGTASKVHLKNKMKDNRPPSLRSAWPSIRKGFHGRERGNNPGDQTVAPEPSVMHVLRAIRSTAKDHLAGLIGAM